MNQSHKRKRGKPPLLLESPEHRAAKCLSKYHHAGIEASRSLKKALALELQKLKKRLKKSSESTEQNEDALRRIHEETEAAKTLETDDIAVYYLRHTIQKSHVKLSEYLNLVGPVQAPHKDAPDAAKNVVARLLGSKVFKESITSCIERLEAIAGIIQPVKKAPKSSDSERPAKKTMSNDQQRPKEVPFTSFERDEQDDNGDSDDEGIIQSVRVRSEPDPTSQASTFLPSLQSGYLPADNSSDDEQEVKGLFPAQKKERKNRRGQRARRKILEAKHGNKANHLIKERENKQKEYEERVARRAAREEARTGANAIAIEAAEKNRRERREAALRPIHTSWALAKAQKEKMKTAKPQGVKISFD